MRTTIYRLNAGLLGVVVLLALVLCPVVVYPQSNESGAALLAAAGEGNAEGVVAALSQGADVNTRNVDGWTALLFASIRGAQDVVTILLAADADVNAQNTDGATPLMAAAVMGEREIAELLVKAGADLSLRNVAGATARIKAEEYGHPEVAQMLAAYEPAPPAPVRASESERALLQSAPEPAPAVIVTRSPPPAPAPEPSTSGRTATTREPFQEARGDFQIEPMNADYVINKGANMRALPDPEATRVGSLPKGTLVRVTGRVVGRNWYRVRNGRAQVYVFGSVLTEGAAELPPVAAAPPVPQAAPVAERVVVAAAPTSALAQLSGRWASADNPAACVGEYLEIRSQPESVSLFVHSGGEAFPLGQDLPITHSEGSEIQAGPPDARWTFTVSRNQLLYSRFGRDPAHYTRCP
jgi:hypothetical protein